MGSSQRFKCFKYLNNSKECLVLLSLLQQCLLSEGLIDKNKERKYIVFDDYSTIFVTLSDLRIKLEVIRFVSLV